jgi:hypothetical protein
MNFGIHLPRFATWLRIVKSSWLRKKASGAINKALGKQIVDVNGIINLVRTEHLTAKEIDRLHYRSQNALMQFRKVYTSIEKLEFLNSNVTQNLAGKLLDTFYELEFELRKKADVPGVNPFHEIDRELIDAASNISLRSIAEY